MYYVLSALAGLLFGGLAGYIKYFLLWRKLVRDESAVITSKQLYLRMGISSVVNIVILAVVFFARKVVPLDFVVMILATAIALSLTGKLSPMKTIAEHVKEDSSC